MIYPVLKFTLLLQVKPSEFPYTRHLVLVVKFRKEEFHPDNLLHPARNLQQNHLPQSHPNYQTLLLLFKRGNKDLFQVIKQ